MENDVLDSTSQGTFDQGAGQETAAPVEANSNSYPDASQIANEGQQNIEPVQSAQPAAAPSWNPEEWKLNYRGQTIQPDSKEKLIALAQQGYSYSQSMEMLNRQRSQYEQQYGSYRQLAEAFQKDPALAAHVSEAIKSYMSQGGDPSKVQNEQGALNPEIMTKIQELDSFKTEFQNKQADDALKTEIDKLKSAYPDQPWDVNNGDGTLLNRLLKHCLEGEYPTLQAAFRDMNWDTYMTNAQAQALKAQQAQQAQLRKQGIVEGGRPTQSGGGQPQQNTGGYKSGDSYKDLTEKALREFRT